MFRFFLNYLLTLLGASTSWGALGTLRGVLGRSWDALGPLLGLLLESVGFFVRAPVNMHENLDLKERSLCHNATQRKANQTSTGWPRSRPPVRQSAAGRLSAVKLVAGAPKGTPTPHWRGNPASG